MGRAITLTDVATTSVSSNADVNIMVELSSMERPIIKVDKLLRHERVNDNWVAVTTKRKFLVERLTYTFDTYEYRQDHYKTKDVLKLAYVTGRYFNANKKLALSLDNVLSITDEMLKDIPDKLHDYARQQFADVIQKQLGRVLDKGVVVEGEINA